ncbi:MAG: DUF1566 domain-containing protein [Thermodesulfobacteriota bacterium]|nr:DUF1566 domain-containing protein [Thermodesulfobacteriota bacterium]
MESEHESFSYDTSYSNESLIGAWFCSPSSDDIVDKDIYLVFDASLGVEIGAFYPLSLTYSMESDGSFIISDSSGSIFGYGQLTSSREGTAAMETSSGTVNGVMKKIDDLSVCQGTWTGQFTETGGSVTYEVDFVVDSSGNITSFNGFSSPVTGKIFCESETVVGFFKTGESVSYNQVQIYGTLSGDSIIGTYEIDDGDSTDGTFEFLRQSGSNQTDTDGDGVPDDQDSCPDTPAGESVDANGCSASQLDSDGDGISIDGDGSGVIGDNPCTGGVTANCDDNCRYAYNPDQADSDGDGIGDACGGALPDTGQTTCYDNSAEITCPEEGEPFYGQDAQYIINPQSYTKLDENGNDLPDAASSWVMVRDNVTGLIWEVKEVKDGTTDYSNPHDADNVYTWYDSNPDTNGGDAGTPGDGTDTEDFIKALNDAQFGGYTDWRMPTVNELSLIVNSGTDIPAINAGYFPNTVSSYYWSSTTVVYLTYGAFHVNFIHGFVDVYFKSISYYARAVRGGTTTSAFVDNSDGTVTDTSTGLIWQQETAGPMSWEDALDYCENLSLAGNDDWRLPNRAELQSLVDYARYDPGIDTSAFPDTLSSYHYWSSTTTVYDTDFAWLVRFIYDGLGSAYKFDNYYVHAVRGGQ